MNLSILKMERKGSGITVGQAARDPRRDSQSVCLLFSQLPFTVNWVPIITQSPSIPESAAVEIEISEQRPLVTI